MRERARGERSKERDRKRSKENKHIERKIRGRPC